MKIKEILERNPVIPAIKDKETFETALISNNEIVFVIMSNIINIKEI
ncbi:MAG: glycerol-3-phosphate responsive antiterminator, partial [Fusobacterium sp.]|nr:glycerol-3-phosphate responsive antiterminator [Fusobacterium sp.]